MKKKKKKKNAWRCAKEEDMREQDPSLGGLWKIS